jgi:hypothetical protein
MQTIALTTKSSREEFTDERGDDLHASEKDRIIRSQECVRILLE